MLSNNRVPLGSRPLNFSTLAIPKLPFRLFDGDSQCGEFAGFRPRGGRKLPVKRTSGGGSGLICADVRAGQRKISNKTITRHESSPLFGWQGRVRAIASSAHTTVQCATRNGSGQGFLLLPNPPCLSFPLSKEGTSSLTFTNRGPLAVGKWILITVQYAACTLPREHSKRRQSETIRRETLCALLSAAISLR